MGGGAQQRKQHQRLEAGRTELAMVFECSRESPEGRKYRRMEEEGPSPVPLHITVRSSCCFSLLLVFAFPYRACVDETHTQSCYSFCNPTLRARDSMLASAMASAAN